MEQLTKNQAVATSQEAVQNQNEPQLRDENAHNDKSVHGVLNPTYQAGLRRDARSEERFSRNAETDLVCRLLLEKKKIKKDRLNVYDTVINETSSITNQTNSSHALTTTAAQHANTTR